MVLLTFILVEKFQTLNSYSVEINKVRKNKVLKMNKISYKCVQNDETESRTKRNERTIMRVEYFHNTGFRNKPYYIIINKCNYSNHISIDLDKDMQVISAYTTFNIITPFKKIVRPLDKIVKHVKSVAPKRIYINSGKNLNELFKLNTEIVPYSCSLDQLLNNLQENVKKEKERERTKYNSKHTDEKVYLELKYKKLLEIIPDLTKKEFYKKFAF